MDDKEKLKIKKICDITANIWIEASAGTGKTKVLVDRILALLVNNVPIDKILCITFTNSAASEMLSRIKDKLLSWKNADFEQVRSQLQEMFEHTTNEQVIYAKNLFNKILDTNQKLRVQTIHGFCQNLLETFSFEADVSVPLNILSESETDEILEKSLKKSISLSKNTPYLFKAFEILSLFKSDEGLLLIIKKLINDRLYLNSLCANTPENLADSYSKLFQLNIDLNDINIEQILSNNKIVIPLSIKENIFNIYSDISSKLTQDDSLLSSKILYCFSNLQEDYQNIEDNDIFNIFLTKDGGLRQTLYPAKLKKLFPAHCDNIDEIAKEIFSLFNQQSTQKFALSNLALSLALKDIYTQCQSLKNERLDYDDLIFKTLLLLKNNHWIRYKINESLNHVLLDEAQDTSPIQWEILRTICSDDYFSNQTGQPKTLFVVGDQKQAIYGFQGADLKSFLANKNHLQSEAKIHNPRWHEIPLNVSFRSTPAILSFIDDIFKDPTQTSGVGKIPTKHIPFRLKEVGKVEFWSLEKKPQLTNQETSSNPFEQPSEHEDDQIINLATKIASNIKQIIDTKTFVPSKKRPATPKDFLILLQQRGKLMTPIINALKKADLPVDGADRISLIDEILVEDLISLAKFVTNPYDDMNLACLLKSSIVGIDDKELSRICIHRPSFIFEQLKSDTETQDIYSLLSEWLTLGNGLSPYMFFSQLLDNPKFALRKKFHSHFGEGFQDILNEFMEHVFVYERAGLLTISGFIPWFKKHSSNIKREFKQNEKIQVMTVHRSKGLQAPFVIIADINGQGKNELPPTWINSDESYTNILPIFFPPQIKTPNNVCAGIETFKEEQKQEKQRLLYVALSRAQDNLYVTGRETRVKTVWFNLLEQYYVDC